MSTISASHLFNWTDTTLWSLLKDSAATESDRIRTILQVDMPKIQSLLTQGGTSPLDFTLHDAQHSYRVAQRMVDIIPASTIEALSPYEFALLLLSAYLHDIGMTPSQALVNQIRTYITVGTEDLVPPEVLASFQIWSDSLDSDAKEALMRRPLTSPEDLRVANRITAFFCRYRHVELSEQWIDTHLKGGSLGSYAQWVTDLKLLCRSHNEGFEFLTTKQFDPKPVGTPGHIVHLRYLACALRVADVLEFDPERTPEVVFSHRDIAPGSEIYWFKDHYPTLTMERGQLTITANPPNAKIHRAIEVMCDEIEEELRLVSRINDEFPFTTLPFQSAAGRHEWLLSSNLRRHISPLNGRYHYINGAFRPDTHKVLQLLSGKRLYKHEHVALRELLQNSFDAVRERIALERLTKRHPEDVEWQDRLSKIYSVTLDVKTEDDRIWITCTDDGVGMSQGIIMNYLLVSGLSQRPDLWQLDRRCREKGFEFERTGQFGIGVLSYFMIADLVRFETRRNALCPDAERSGWIFETEGIGSFGELRPCEVAHLGTRVSLRLRPEVVSKMSTEPSCTVSNDYFSTFHSHASHSRYPSLTEYILRILCQVPCNVEISEDGVSLMTLGPGWNNIPVVASSQLREALALWSETELETGELVPKEKAQLIEISNQRARAHRGRYEEYLKWEVFDGMLLDGAVSYRFWLPVFNLPEGEAPAFAIPELVNGDLFLHPTSQTEYRTYFFSRPEGTVLLSWKGMYLELENGAHTGVLGALALHGILQVDIRSEACGVLSVSRETISLSAKGISSITAILSALTGYYEVLRKKFERSPFSRLWQLLAEGRLDANLDAPWPQSAAGGEDVLAWNAVKSVGLDISGYSKDVASGICEMTWNDAPVNWLRDVEIECGWKLYHSGGWTKSSQSFHETWSDYWMVDRVVKMTGVRPLKLAAVHTHEKHSRVEDGVHQCAFPPEWSNLVGVEIRRYPRLLVFNAACPINQTEHSLSKKWLEETRLSAKARTGREVKIIDPRPVIAEMLEDRSKAAAWLRDLMVNGTLGTEATDAWNALVESEPELVNAMSCFQTTESELLFAFGLEYWWSAKLLRLGPKGAQIEDDHVRLHELLPTPRSSKWRLSVEVK